MKKIIKVLGGKRNSITLCNKNVKYVLNYFFMNIFNKGDKFMVFVKYIVLFFIFFIAAWIGNLISKKYRNRVNELKIFKEAFNILESKIKFTYEPLGEIFEEISNLYSKNSIKYIFISAKENMNNLGVKKSWDDAINSNSQRLCLNNEDLNIIKSLGNMLGKTDVDGQLNEIKLSINFLDTQIAIAEEECKKNEKMYRTLGTIFGLAIIIILI